ncbi:MAG: SAM-dependent methyltransferase [Candidatus Thorarchaeota archaeon]
MKQNKMAGLQIALNILLITVEVHVIHVARMSDSKSIQVFPIGYVMRESAAEDEREPSHVVRIIIDNELAPSLVGIEEWSHIYIIYYMHEVSLDRSEWAAEGVLAARSPKHPNSIGLTLVELLRHEDNVLWVRGLDASDGSPVLDIKPYPDWGRGQWKLVREFRVPAWLREINEDP